MLILIKMYTNINKLNYDPDPFSSSPKQDIIFIKRIDCWEDTKKKCNEINKYNNCKIITDPPKSIKIHWTPIDTNNKQCENSNIIIENMDTIECGFYYKNMGYKPLLLNLADDCYAGGCVDTGSGAQEESLFRCSNYHKTLKMIPELYPIKDNEAILSYGVSIIKKSEQNGWENIPFISNPPKLSFIACPAVKYPIIEFIDGEKRLKEEDVVKLEKKIELILQTAYKGGFDTIIWGAMGCGAWRNPSYHVAEIMIRILKQYNGMIKNNVFAILKMSGDNYITNKSNLDNYDIFTEVFNR
jgi:uncharacterized protein (TIGR02452 family)